MTVQVGIRRLVPQPLVGILTMGLAILTLAVPMQYQLHNWFNGGHLNLELVGIVLVACHILTYRFPIHIRRHTKIQVGSVPLFLMVVLLPPPVAVAAASIGTLAGELLTRSQRGFLPSDIASHVGRWMVLAGLGSVVAHQPTLMPGFATLPWVQAATLLWAGDILTSPLVLSPISGESPLRVIRAVFYEAGLTEGTQYLVALLGAVAARQELWTLLLLTLPTFMVYVTARRARETSEESRRLLENMADTVDLRDPYTGGHSRRVTEYTQGILRELAIGRTETELIVTAARVHDIGKIAVPDGILNKPGPLTKEERQLMQTHSEAGANFLQRYPDFAAGVAIVRHHHERWDGDGYPHHLKGVEIPFGARVIAVADSFDAMTSDRPYRYSMTSDEAASILREGRGTQWDAEIVDAFLRSIADRLNRPVAPRLQIVPPREADSIASA